MGGSMAYQALYRKWRPTTFEDVKGQDHIVTALKNQIKMNRIGHAYLFCGTRGTGKTSVAKIFARAVNCLHPVDGSPCNECAMCRAINAQTSMNVIEIDAASNNGVDNVREILDEVSYSPTEGRYRVYIIDEVHMLSPSAFNALLKTLEEPPPYVIFILATTDVQKVPVTILSRCQRYDFRHISVETIVDRLDELISNESLDIEDRAVRYIAGAADGSLRDAISLLDQCVSFYLNQHITYDNVLEVLGAVDTSVFSRMLRLIIGQDITGAIYLLEEIITQGRELSQFVTDFIWYLRNLLLAQTAEDLENILDVSSENMAALREEAAMVDADTLMRYIRVFSELSGQMRYSSQKRVLLEVALVKLCKPSMERSYDSVLSRLALIEKQLEEGVVISREMLAGGFSAAGEGTGLGAGKMTDFSGQPGGRAPGLSGQAGASGAPGFNGQFGGGAPGFGGQSAGGGTPDRAAAMPEDVRRIIRQWGKVVSDLTKETASMLKNVRVSQGEDSTLILSFRDVVYKNFFDQEEHRTELEHVIEDKLQKSVTVKTVLAAEEAQTQQNFFDPRKFNLSGVEVEYED